MSATQTDDAFIAWQTFFAEDIVLENRVRLEIARSWQRCREFNLDPWSSPPHPNHDELRKKRTQYNHLLPIVTPVAEYIKTLMDANGLIADANGFIYELLSPIKNYPRSLGTYQIERNYGTFSSTIAIAEQIAIRTDGYEHYLISGHNRSCVSSPMFDKNHNMFGVVSAVRTFEKLPSEALNCVKSFAKLVEFLVHNDESYFKIPKNLEIFETAINACPHGVLSPTK